MRIVSLGMMVTLKVRYPPISSITKVLLVFNNDTLTVRVDRAVSERPPIFQSII